MNVKHKNDRAHLGVIQAILCISRSINVCRQIVLFLAKGGMNVKHKNGRAHPGMIQAIICISRSRNVCRQMVLFGKTQNECKEQKRASTPRHDTSHTMYYWFYKRVQANDTFMATRHNSTRVAKELPTPRSNRKTTHEYNVKHKRRRANPGMIQAIL